MKVIPANVTFKEALVPLDFSKVFFIILHHLKADFASVETIHKWHLDRGWNGFGYNEYIMKDGTVVMGREDHVGAQCSGMNSKSYGIALEGDFSNSNQMTDKQMESLIKRIRYHKLRFPNKVTVEPHNKFQATACPGAFFPILDIQNRTDELSDTQHFQKTIEEQKITIKTLKNKNIELEEKLLLAEYENDRLLGIIKKVRTQYEDLYNIYKQKVKTLQSMRRKKDT